MARLGRCGEVCVVGQSGRGWVSYGRLGMVRNGSHGEARHGLIRQC